MQEYSGNMMHEMKDDLHSTSDGNAVLLNEQSNYVLMLNSPPQNSSVAMFESV